MKIWTIHIVFWSILLGCISLGYADNSSLVFHQLSIKDGLSEGSVRAIIEDKRGFMWFGTEDGLNKYDGYKFTVYKHDIADKYSMMGNNIKCLYNDSHGNLWIGTRHGINIYDHVKDQFYNLNNDKYLALKDIDGDVESVFEDPMGNIWILTNTMGLFKISSLHQRSKRFVLSSPTKLHGYACFTGDAYGNLYVGTYEGLVKFNTHTNTYVDLEIPYNVGCQVRDIYVASKTQLWLTTTDGLKSLDLTTGKVKSYSYSSSKNSILGNNAVQIIPDHGRLLIAIDGKGIDLFDPKTELFTHYSKETGTQLSSNNITSIYRDSKGTLWVGTFLNGINYSNITTNFFVYVKNNSPSNNSIKNGVLTNFLKDSKNNFWISTDGGGLYVKKQGTDQFINYTSENHPDIILSNAVISMMEDSEHNLWITTYAGGLTRISPSGQTKIFNHDPKNPNSLIFDKVKAVIEYRGQIWVSSFGMGISVLDKKTEAFRHYSYGAEPGALPSNWAFWMYEDRKGTLWLATFDGLCRYIPEKDQFKTYKFNKENRGEDRNHIFDVTEDSENNLWIGSNGGLILFDRETEKFTTYTTKDGLSDNTVKSVMEDNKKKLWLATNNGITEFSIKERKATPYNLNDGLPAGSFFVNSKFKDGNGKIYFGMNEGYLMIDPKLSTQTISFPKVVLTELRIFNNPITPKSVNSPLECNIIEAKEINLNYDQNSLSFEFAGLNFSIPKHNFYAYKLEGFDKDWNYAGKNRVAKYTNLDPKDYVFKVKASNNEKIWQEYSTNFEIHIAPPFWQTWWFKLLEVTTAISLIMTFYYFRTRSIVRKNKWLTEQVSVRTQELQEINLALSTQTATVLQQKHSLELNNAKQEEYNQLLHKLIGIISHDIRGPIQRFSMLLQYMNESTKDFIMEKLKENAATLSLLTTDLLSWVRMQSSKDMEISDFEWEEVWEKTHRELDTFKEEKKLSFEVIHHTTGPAKGVAVIAQAAIRNIMSNAIKYSEPGGIILIETGIQQDQYTALRVTDYGKGFDAAQINKLIGGEVFNGMKSVTLQEGAGLGMSICYDMVRRCGGWIEAKSLPNSGGTFFVYFPKGN